MKQKRVLALLTAIVCLFGLMAGLLSGCNSEEEADSKLQVSFDLNYDGAGENPAAIEVTKGQAYGQLPAVTVQREGFTFGGWCMDAKGKGDLVTAETVVTAETDHTLYAKWIGDKITVSFDLQGGTINGVSTVEDAEVTVGNVYSMMAIPEDPKWDDHAFLGWYYDPEGKEGPVRESTKVVKTEDHTLYAVWQEFQLFYDFEGGEGQEIFSGMANAKFAVEAYDGSDQLKITTIGTEQADGSLLMWRPLNVGTKVTMDITFTGALPAENARMHLFCYGVNEAGVPMTEGVIDITQSEIHRRWYHGNGFRAMQESGVWHYGDEGNWKEGNTCRFEMYVMEDCAGLYMTVCLGSEVDATQLGQNAIYIDNIEFTPNAMRVLEDGMMDASAYGATEQGIYFMMNDNELPYGDWDVYYDATSEENVKLIRDGKVYCVAETGCDNICKFGKTDYYLRLEKYTIGSAAPISTTDMFIVEGDFKYEDSILTVKKTYIYHDGTAWVFVDQLPEELAPESEEPVEMVDPYYGILRSHEAGATDQGIYFLLSDNGLPFGDWNVYYDATSEDNVKIIRDGKVYCIAVPGCDNICKFGKEDYYLRLENYTIGSYAPISTEDIFIVEGKFAYENSTLNINKTYIYHNGSGWVFTTKLPAELAPETEEPTVPSGIGEGMMAASNLGATDQGIYFLMDDNGLPYGDWSVYYDATTADDVKLIRDGKVYSIAVPGCDNICKFSATDYYIRLENYTIGSYAPISTADIFVVEGSFTYEDSTLTLKKNYIYHDGAAWVFAAELPEDLMPDEGGEETPVTNETGVLAAHSAGVNADSTTGEIKGIYAIGNAVNTTYNSDWSVEYTPVSAENYKLIRGGVTYNIGVPGEGTLVLISPTDMYLKQEAHCVAGSETLLPIQVGDVLVVEGQWSCNQDANSVLNITTTYILIGQGTATFSDTNPNPGEGGEEGGEEENGTYQLGVLTDHWAGVNVDSATGAVKGIYATGAATEATYNSDWTVEYTPVSAENYKLIRNGVTYNVGITGPGTLVLFGQTDLYLKQESHTFTETLLPIQVGDILVVEGQWSCNQDANSVINITTTYILIGEGTATFSDTNPNPDEGGEEGGEEDPATNDTGVLSAHSAGVNVDSTTGAVKGIYAVSAATNATYNSDWSVEYTPVSAENYKLIRGGVTYNIGAPGEGTLVLISPTDMYLKQESHCVAGSETLLPIQVGDVLVVEGQWTCNQDANSALNITTTYILIGQDTATFSDTNPNPDEGGEEGGEEETGPYQVGTLSSHSDGVVKDAGGNITGMHVTGAATNATYNSDWSVEYTPVSAENYKLIRNGVTYNVGVPGQGTLVMFGQTEFYLKQESHTFAQNLLPMQDGDILVVEGEWSCKQDASAVLSITTTYIRISGGEASFSGAEPDAGGEEETGVYTLDVLTAHDAGVNADSTTGNIKGIYAKANATNATFNSDWSVEYTPASAENYKLIRNGATYNIGMPGQGTLVLFSQTELYLKQESHTVADSETLLPIQDGDMLVVEGEWTCNQDADSTLNLTATYILISNGEATFLDADPNEDASGAYQLGSLLTHWAGVNVDSATGNIKGIYATGAATEATYNSDWSVEYTPVSAENYKLIRGGVTYNIGVPGEGTLVLFGQTDIYLKQESHCVAGSDTLLPIRNGDILVIEGKWSCNQDENSVVNIAKTYILISNNSATFSDTDPEA